MKIGLKNVPLDTFLTFCVQEHLQYEFENL